MKWLTGYIPSSKSEQRLLLLLLLNHGLQFAIY